jgi:hypothetical protein
MAKRFEGTFVGGDLFKDKLMSKTEWLVYVYMNSFEHEFFAGDAHMAKILDTNVQVIRNAVCRLRKKGFIVGHNKTRKPRPYDIVWRHYDEKKHNQTAM